MTKQEFVDQVADRAGLSKKDAGGAVDAFLETLEDAHRTAHELQDVIGARLDGADVLIHLEPQDRVRPGEELRRAAAAAAPDRD